MIKQRKIAKYVLLQIVTLGIYGLFCNGLQEFDKAYENGVLDGVFTTNLVYRTPELLEKPWYFEVDMSKYCSLIIDTLNHDATISNLLLPAGRIEKLLEQIGQGK